MVLLLRRLVCLLVLATCVVVSVAVAAPLTPSASSYYEESFQAWKAQYGKIYADIFEELHRMGIFTSNLMKVDAWNHANHTPGQTYTMGMNQFGDLTFEEFSRRMWPNRQNNTLPNSQSSHSKRVSNYLPDAIDWRTKGVVTEVKNQGQCGSCWSFSATGAMEAAHAIATGKLESLSEQQLIDCEPTNLGCNGGLAPNAFVYVDNGPGMVTEAAYPYEGLKNKECKLNSSSNYVAKFTSYTELNEGDESGLQSVIANISPVSCGIDAGGDGNFQFYKSGVFKSTKCTTVIDHAILVVGYAVDAATNEKYWIVKNQWGTSWGIDGYFWLYRGSNMCGIAEYCSYIHGGK